MKPDRPEHLPGDASAAVDIAPMIRVDQAGEYGAVRIYEGQLAVTGRGRARDEIRRMAEQEKRHLTEFETLMRARRVRPTALQPVWHVAGYLLGAATGLLGERAAMACTVAVEETIDAHYAGQVAELGDDEAGLRETVEVFRREELEHRDTALAHEAERAPGYRLLTAIVRTGCRAAIRLSERV
jgi:3-demethoxyubiquinol 3-hydroxylase